MSRRGMENDGLTKLMKRLGIPVTREDYLNLAYLGEAPEELGAEQEDQLPAIVRRDASADTEGLESVKKS